MKQKRTDGTNEWTSRWWWRREERVVAIFWEMAERCLTHGTRYNAVGCRQDGKATSGNIPPLSCVEGIKERPFCGICDVSHGIESTISRNREPPKHKFHFLPKQKIWPPWNGEFPPKAVFWLLLFKIPNILKNADYIIFVLDIFHAKRYEYWNFVPNEVYHGRKMFSSGHHVGLPALPLRSAAIPLRQHWTRGRFPTAVQSRRIHRVQIRKFFAPIFHRFWL